MEIPNAHTSSVTAGEAFGRLASSYDEDFETLPAARRLRQLIWSIYLRHFTAGDSLLELNCGTGTDALALAQRGMNVHATDISSGMLDSFQQKLSGSPLRDRITTEILAFSQLSQLRGRKFDGVYSNMGGLNCEGDLGGVASNLHELIRSGGTFIGTFLGDKAVWEMLSFGVRGNIRDALRRRSPDGCMANVGGAGVRTFYYSPARVVEVFKPHFTKTLLVGLNIFTPPPTSRHAYRALGRAMRLLEWTDDVVMYRFPFNRIGDHFLIVLKHVG